MTSYHWFSHRWEQVGCSILFAALFCLGVLGSDFSRLRPKLPSHPPCPSITILMRVLTCIILFVRAARVTHPTVQRFRGLIDMMEEMRCAIYDDSESEFEVG